jgi:hypothetical protein
LRKAAVKLEYSRDGDATWHSPTFAKNPDVTNAHNKKSSINYHIQVLIVFRETLTESIFNAEGMINKTYIHTYIHTYIQKGCFYQGDQLRAVLKTSSSWEICKFQTWSK